MFHILPISRFYVNTFFDFLRKYFYYTILIHKTTSFCFVFYFLYLFRQYKKRCSPYCFSRIFQMF